MSAENVDADGNVSRESSVIHFGPLPRPVLSVLLWFGRFAFVCGSLDLPPLVWTFHALRVSLDLPPLVLTFHVVRGSLDLPPCVYAAA